MLALCFSAFVCFGFVLILAGANQAEIARELHLDLAQSGLLGSALALGLGFGVVAAGPLFDRTSRRPLFVGSTALAGAALVCASPGIGFHALLGLVVAIGFGIGVYDTFINAVVVERFQDEAARPMTLVHAGATVGAMVGPLVIGALDSQIHWTTSFRVVGIAHWLIAAWALRVTFPALPTGGANDLPQDSARSLLRSAALWPFAAVAFAYVGVESAMTLFAIPYADGALGLDLHVGRSAISGLWLGLFAGRMTTALFPPSAGARLIVAAGLASAVCVAAATGFGAPQVVAIFTVTGFTLGCVYPVMIAGAGRQFPEKPGTAAGLVAGAGAIGGFFVPWLTGAIGDALGIATGLGTIAFWSATIALGGVAIARLPRLRRLSPHGVE